MRHVEFYLDDFEHQRLKAMKGHNRSWREFVLQLAGILKKEAGDDE